MSLQCSEEVQARQYRLQCRVQVPGRCLKTEMHDGKNGDENMHNAMHLVMTDTCAGVCGVLTSVGAAQPISADKTVIAAKAPAAPPKTCICKQLALAFLGAPLAGMSRLTAAVLSPYLPSRVSHGHDSCYEKGFVAYF